MKTLKHITAALLALPLALGSISALAEDDQARQTKPAHHMNFVTKGLELTKEQKQQFRDNIAKAAATPSTLELKEVPTKEARIATMFEGIELTEEQKARAIANLEKGDEIAEKIVGKIKDKMAKKAEVQAQEQQPVTQ